MIWTRNVIHAAYGLAIVLISTAGLFVLLNAEYLAVVQLFMYAGGVVVLLVFGIMLVNRTKDGVPITRNTNVFPGIVLSLLFLGILVDRIGQYVWVWGRKEIAEDQVREIGELLITDHLLAFELIAILLLAVLVGAAYLAKKSVKN